jgi:hypothetical protein
MYNDQNPTMPPRDVLFALYPWAWIELGMMRVNLGGGIDLDMRAPKAEPPMRGDGNTMPPWHVLAALRRPRLRRGR